MARYGITAQPLPNTYTPAVPLAAASADLLFTAVDDPISRSTPLVTSKTVVLAQNTDTGAHTITFTGVMDAMNRSGDITNYSVAAGHIACFGPFQAAGFAQPGALLYIDIDDPRLRLAVLQLP